MKNQPHSISGFNSGLQVRVLPGSPLFSPNYFCFYQFNRHRGIASASELRTSENKTPATRSTAFLCESGTKPLRNALAATKDRPAIPGYRWAGAKGVPTGECSDGHAQILGHGIGGQILSVEDRLGRRRSARGCRPVENSSRCMDERRAGLAQAVAPAQRQGTVSRANEIAAGLLYSRPKRSAHHPD